MDQINDQLIMIAGESAAGKSASLRNLKGGEKVLYLNCESGKRLPFRNNFTTKTITDPYQIYEAFAYAAANPGTFNCIVIDTLTFLMDMFESLYIVGAENTMAGWASYQQFFKNLMQQHVAASKIPVIFLAHTKSELDEASGTYHTAIPVKGALKNNGIEAYFSTVVAAKKVPISVLEEYNSNLLTVTEEDRMLGYKHVYQTRLTKGTTGERIRSPMGMFEHSQTYMDNDAALLIEHLNEFYGLSAAA